MTLSVIYFGTTSEFSRLPLEALLSAGIDVRAVVVPMARMAGSPPRLPIARVVADRQHSPLPIANPYLARTIVQIAIEREIAVFEVGSLAADATLTELAALRPDVGCVACFPQRFPPALLALARYGFLNIHPALLPAYRGPTPLFWAFRNGERVTGVTLHFMDEGLDTGDIVAQTPVEMPDGISEAAAERACALLGGRLLAEALAGGALTHWPQPPGGSYDGWPTTEDFTFSTDWTARRAFNFMRGTAGRGQPYHVLIAGSGEYLTLTAALAYMPDQALGANYIRIGNEVHIQFTPGVLVGRR